MTGDTTVPLLLLLLLILRSAEFHTRFSHLNSAAQTPSLALPVAFFAFLSVIRYAIQGQRRGGTWLSSACKHVHAPPPASLIPSSHQHRFPMPHHHRQPHKHHNSATNNLHTLSHRLIVVPGRNRDRRCMVLVPNNDQRAIRGKRSSRERDGSDRRPSVSERKRESAAASRHVCVRWKKSESDASLLMLTAAKVGHSVFRGICVTVY